MSSFTDSKDVAELVIVELTGRPSLLLGGLGAEDFFFFFLTGGGGAATDTETEAGPPFIILGRAPVLAAAAGVDTVDIARVHVSRGQLSEIIHSDNCD